LPLSGVSLIPVSLKDLRFAQFYLADG